MVFDEGSKAIVTSGRASRKKLRACACESHTSQQTTGVVQGCRDEQGSFDRGQALALRGACIIRGCAATAKRR